MSSLDEYSFRPKFANYLESDHRVGYQQHIPPPLPGQRPPTGDDPLLQWRQRRRIEVAQQSAPQHTQQFDFLNKTEQQKKMDSKLEEFKQRLAGRAPARSQVQFTPAPLQQQTQTSVQNQQQTESGGFHEPQIASPCLHRPKPRSEPVEEIDPHLHLMCDLLPCPHRGNFQENETKYNAGQGTSMKGNNSRDNFEREENSCTKDGENSKDMGKYKQYLEAEKPDVEKSNSDLDNCDIERMKELETDRKSEQKSIQEIENMVKDIGSKDDDKYTRKKDEDEENGSKNLDRRRHKDLNEQNSEHSGSESERSRTKYKHLDKGARQTEGAERVKESQEKRDKVLKPTHSSSPKNGRRGVSAAIGQVIKEHLFSTSTSTVLSSVDSLPPSASTERLPWKHKPPSHDQSHDQQSKHQEDNDMLNESDEDFSEDNLLQMLRKQRAMYEQQLQEIDGMLNRMEPR